jgi:hypothetical protein
VAEVMSRVVPDSNRGITYQFRYQQVRKAPVRSQNRITGKVSGLGAGQTGRVGILVGHHDLPVLPDR